MEPLPHGYTNRTARDGGVVLKTYQGRDAAERAAREERALRALRGRLPVPEILDAPGREGLTMTLLPGVHGQDLIDAGHAAEVLRSCGRMLRQVHDEGWAHGDFGPNNVLLEPDGSAVTAVLDWEWAAEDGDELLDLAWCEWIVRTHHPAHTAALGGFFDVYGHRPPWPRRQAAMAARCGEFVAYSAEVWRPRLAATLAWTEEP